MANPCVPTVISVEHSLSSLDELDTVTERLNPIIRRLVEEAGSRQSGGYSKIVIKAEFEKSIGSK